MKIALSMLHFALVRNFEPVVRALAERGHHVHLSADEPETLGGLEAVTRLAGEYPNISFDFAPSFEDEPWHHAVTRLRIALDLVRFSGREYAGSPKLRRRYTDRAPRLVRRLLPFTGAPVWKRLLTRVERLAPRSAAGDAHWRRLAPDVLLLTSLTVSRSRQMDHLKSARVLGIPVAACIASWDHLSSKALLHIEPDLTIVWNQVQVREAVELHGLDAGRLVVTGAQCYDAWFGRQPHRSREEFCRAMGLRPDRPFVLYVCSALTPAPDPLEPVFVRRWIDALRADPELRDIGVLVRPHPERRRDWNGVSLDGLPQVAFYGSNPIDEDSKNDYFDSLFHSSAVVGVVTSAFLEACIVGRPILTVLVPEYRSHQEEMVHFQYLLQVDGGILQTAPDLPVHRVQLREAVRQQGRDERNRRFLTTFVRPEGLGTAATPAFVAAVERLAGAGAAPMDAGLVGSALWRRGAGVAMHALGSTKLGRWLLMDTREEVNVAIERGKERERRARMVDNEARLRAELRDRDDRIRGKDRARKAKARRRAWRDARAGVAAQVRRTVRIGTEAAVRVNKWRRHAWRELRARGGTARRRLQGPVPPAPPADRGEMVSSKHD